MVPAVNDSEDEDAEILVEDDRTQRSFSGPAQAEATTVTTTQTGIHVTEQSTGSTEKIYRQIQNLTEDLGAISSGENPSVGVRMAVSDSSHFPSDRPAKRRHATYTGADSPAASTPDKRLKRAKTLKTYGSRSSHEHQFEEQVAFAEFRKDGNVPVVSAEVPPLEHTEGLQLLGSLPYGTAQQEFLNHEPAIMFRDTGSTVLDRDSSQLRWAEQARDMARAVERISADEVGDATPRYSSSIPSELFKTSAQPVASSTCEGDGTAAETVPDSVPFDDSGCGEQHEREPQDPGRESLTRELTPFRRTALVEIVRQRPEAEFYPEDPSDEAPKPTRGRKKKEPETFTDPPNSDDVAIGLPKDLYQPRPTRRRATLVSEPAIDYSVIPEKAAKKRRKTAETLGLAVSTTSIDQQAERADGVRNESHDEPTGLGPESRVKQTPAQLSRSKRDGSEIPVPLVQTIETQLVTTKDNKLQGSSQKARVETTASAGRQDLVEPVFVKPDLPSSSSHQKRPRRSVTTIYEDMGGSQRSPSLSQQQAQRMAALKDITNERVQTSRTKRRTIIQDDDDDEDELAKDSTTISMEREAPKKRGRGRPPKAGPTQTLIADDGPAQFDEIVEETVETNDVYQAKAKAVSDQTSAQDTSEATESANYALGEEKDVDAIPKKRGRGRPSKVVPKPQEPVQADEPEANASLSKTSGTTTTEQESMKAPRLDQSIDNAAPLLRPPTPSPPAKSSIPAESVALPQKLAANPSPNSHSPIKKSSNGVKFQGLSRRARIRPLLSRVNPRPMTR